MGEYGARLQALTFTCLTWSDVIQTPTCTFCYIALGTTTGKIQLVKYKCIEGLQTKQEYVKIAIH